MPLNALLLTKDSDLTRCLSGILDGLEIAVEHCSEPFAAAKRLMDHHFDVVFVDCDDQQGAAWVLQSARMASRLMRRCPRCAGLKEPPRSPMRAMPVNG